MRVEHKYFDDTKVQIIPLETGEGVVRSEVTSPDAQKKSVHVLQRLHKPKRRHFFVFLLIILIMGYLMAEKQRQGTYNNHPANTKSIRRKQTETPTQAPTAPATPTPDSENTTSSSSSYFFPIPKGKVSIRAAEALECRESVVAFVINATDGKDECDGLRRAFDKTCSNTQLEGARRRLRDKTRHVYQWQAIVYHAQRTWRRLWQLPPVFFFAEDEVQAEYDNVRYLVEQDIDNMVYPDVRWRLEMLAQQHRRLQSTNKSKVAYLDIPTGNKQLGNTTASEALLLQQGEGYIEKAVNQSAVAAQHAKQSSKAVADANSAVASLLNDPTSKEARTCCASILNVYHENCSTDEEEAISDVRLFFVVFVLALCGMVKSLIRYYKIFWLPEAAGCILVGVLSGYLLVFLPHHEISFDGNWFLRIMVPPIIFEAAISIDKRSFNRHLVPILIYAVVGTLIATVLTAIVIHRGSVMLQAWCPTIPYVEALTFGALISSIDPIAVLSVLNNMGMTDTDTIYVLIFGESLLNDGVAIVLFHTLVHFLDENLIIDREAIAAASVHFLVVAIGSFLVGVASGMVSTVYYYLFQGCQTPLVEVLMFTCWALLPYYVCDGVGWSGIVASVAAGFVMDLYIIGEKRENEHTTDDSIRSNGSPSQTEEILDPAPRRFIFGPFGLLSKDARTHIYFVTGIIATGMETAIFAYLGLFLFSARYHWNFYHTMIAIFACCVSRAIMIPTLSIVANCITRARNSQLFRSRVPSSSFIGNSNAGVVIDPKMQVVLWFAGLRGAMSFALVEHIPMYDSVSGQGTRLKPELKAMTSATIIFTVFVLGGYTFYLMEQMGIAPTNERKSSETEMIALLNNDKKSVTPASRQRKTPLPGQVHSRSTSKTAHRRPRQTLSTVLSAD